MRVLLVDDNAELCGALKQNLEAECFMVDAAHDGERGSYLARTTPYDLMVLDYNLPKKDGLQVCREVRGAGNHVPIIMLSVRQDAQEKIALLNAGADDYLAKPFSFGELAARMRAVLRRPKEIAEETLSVYDITLDRASQRVMRGGREVYLTRKEFALFEFLLSHKNAVISRGAIMEHVWNSESDPFSNTIEAHVANLRKKLESRNRKRFIFNVPGRGYKIADQGDSVNGGDDGDGRTAE